MPTSLRVDVVPPEATHDLRRRVLRDGRADSNVVFAEDGAPGAFHLGVFMGDRLVGVASFSPEPTPYRPGAVAWRLRGMAVDASVQGQGAGTALLDEAVRRVRASGAWVLWANGRDSALGFYERHGWVVHGEGFVTGEVDLPHHVVVFDL
ncbi:MAG: GNAT family N-acetyltransferase [Actinobacteria bacterium]|nr:GNAT family N-acetyltransferase [Actinomycetota bacterium]